MIDVSENILTAFQSEGSGVIWVRLKGESTSDWLIHSMDDAPLGFMKLCHCNSASYRWVKKVTIAEKLLLGA